MTDATHDRYGAATPEADWEPVNEGAQPTRAQNFVARAVRAVALALPYGFVALVLRLVIARAFFTAGQAKVDGPVIAIVVPVTGWEAGSVTLPMSVKDGAYQMFDQLAALPVPSSVAAPVVSAIEFVLPILIVLGLATRFAALALLVMTLAIQALTGAASLWSLHIFWISILLVLISLGPGLISVDRWLRYLYEK